MEKANGKWNSAGSVLFAPLCLLVLVLTNTQCAREQRQKEIKKEEKAQKIKIDPITTDLLQYLPPVRLANANSDSATTLLITTADVARFDGKKEELSYNQSLQMIDADEPWPPRWYYSPPYFTDEMYESITKANQYRMDFTIDAKVEAGYFSFYKIISQQAIGVGQLVAPDFAGYILLNDRYEPVDTVSSRDKGFNMYFHDVRLGKNGERMVDMKQTTFLDLRQYTNEEKDSAVHCNVDYINILDPDNNTIYVWDPLKHLDPELFDFKQTLASKAFATRHADILEWTRLTSALWDYDGNILYAMKQIGLGKVSKKDGKVIWQINNKDMPVVSGKDTIEWFAPHDFNLLSDNKKSVTYSLFSNGFGKKVASGVVFEMDKVTNKIKLVKSIKVKTPSYVADGQGNIDYRANGDYSMGYGFFEKSDTTANMGYRNVFEYQKTNGKFGVYQLPQWIYVYKARLLDNWPKPQRPVIERAGDSLIVTGYSTDLTWYQLSGDNNRKIKKVANGKSIKPEKGVTYCVEGRYGIGFSVSRVFTN